MGGVKVDLVIRLLSVVSLLCHTGLFGCAGAADRLPGYQLLPQAPTLGPHDQNWE